MKLMLCGCLSLSLAFGISSAVSAAEPHISREVIEWCLQGSWMVAASEAIPQESPPKSSQQDRWDAVYRDGRRAPWDIGRPATDLKQAVENGTLRPCRVVELGCGPGNDAIYLAGRGFDVTAIDIAPTALEQAEKKAGEARVKVRWLHADVLNPPKLEPFDLIYDRGCYHGLRQQNAAGYVETLRRLSHPGTQVLILAGHANEPPPHYGPPRVRETDIRSDFGKWFEFQWLRETRFDSTEPNRKGALAWCILLRRNTETPAAQGAQPGPQSLKVLFIGNSQMQCFDLPQMIKVMSDSAPADRPRIAIGQALLGGRGLKGYWEAGEGPGSPRAMIRAEKWDYVVIQEIFNAREQEFQDYAAKFDDLIRQSGSKTLLFATANVTEYYDASFRYPEGFKRLNDMQLSFGKTREIPVAAAGYAWMKYLGPQPSEQQRLDLYHPDKGHPGPKGTYLYACLLYAVITGKTPEGLTGEFPDLRGGITIAKQEASNMQKAAWQVYQETVQRSQ